MRLGGCTIYRRSSTVQQYISGEATPNTIDTYKFKIKPMKMVINLKRLLGLV